MKRVLSKHGRARFIERVGYMTDEEMLFVATFGKPGFKFKWEPEEIGLVLVTVLFDNKTGVSCKQGVAW